MKFIDIYHDFTKKNNFFLSFLVYFSTLLYLCNHLKTEFQKTSFYNLKSININVTLKNKSTLMKKYEVPTMKLHQLKTGRIMAASLGEATAKTRENSQSGNPDNGGVEDFQVESSVW